MASDNTNRIAKNTAYLYIRQGIGLIISFLTVGVTLDVLGETDYGINSLVAGAVSMFTFLTGAMAIGNERFYAFYLGKGDFVKLRRIFQGTLTLYIIISIVLFILGETFGLWLLNNKLVIPPERHYAANVLFQLGLINLCISLMLPPFTALITAHEDMKFFAKMSLWDAIARLGTIALLYFAPFDKLIAVGAIGLVISLIGQSIYYSYCYKHYPECHAKPVYEKPILRELVGFNFWNLCGNFAWMIKNQGTAFLLNMFFGPIVNAAQSIATGVRGMSSMFAGSFMAAMVPQITKNYANNNYDHMFKLAFSGAKIVFMLMAIIVIPAIFNIEFALNLWLPSIPKYAVPFCQIILIEVLFEQTSGFLATINQATGKIKKYQLLIGFYGCLNLPIAYIALRLGATAEYVFVISLILQLFVIGVRVVFLKRIDPSSQNRCLKNLILPCLASGMVSTLLCYFIPSSDNFIIQVILILLEVIIVACTIFIVALNQEEKKLSLNYISKFFSKITKRTTQTQISL